MPEYPNLCDCREPRFMDKACKEGESQVSNELAEWLNEYIAAAIIALERKGLSFCAV